MDDMRIVFDRTPILLDIMSGGRFKCQVSFSCLPGYMYSESEIKDYVKQQRPSLGVDILSPLKG